MNSPNNGQAQSLAKRIPFVLGFVFTLCLIFFNSKDAYAIIFKNSPIDITTTKYIITQNATNNTYRVVTIRDYGFAPILKVEISLTGGHVASTNLFLETGIFDKYYNFSATGEYINTTVVPGGEQYYQYLTYAFGNLQKLLYFNEPILSKGSLTQIQCDETNAYGALGFNLETPKLINEVYSPRKLYSNTASSTLKFLQPSTNPYLDIVTGFNFLVSYTVTPNTPISEIDLKISSPNLEIENWSITSQEHEIATGKGWIKFFAKDVPIGSHIITASVNDNPITTTIQRLDGGNIDADHDGIDDRTGLPLDDSVKFIQPSTNPFKDTTDGYNFLVSYKVPDNTPLAEIPILIESPTISPSKFSVTSQEHDLVTGIGWIKFFAKEVTVGTHVITATVKGQTTSTTIERLAGSVDADGDGKDDRTGLPVDDGHADYTDIDGTGITGAIENFTGFMGSMSDFSSKLFAFMPTEVKVVMIFVITVMGFIAIKKFIL